MRPYRCVVVYDDRLWMAVSVGLKTPYALCSMLSALTFHHDTVMLAVGLVSTNSR